MVWKVHLTLCNHTLYTLYLFLLEVAVWVCSMAFCSHSRFLNKDLMLPNKCLLQLVRNHFFALLFSFFLPPLCVRWYYREQVSIQGGPCGASLLSTNTSTSTLSYIFPASFFLFSLPSVIIAYPKELNSLRLVPEAWRYILFRLSSHFLCFSEPPQPSPWEHY